MHRIESDTLSKLHADYVAPYIDKIEQQKLEAEDQAVRDDLNQAQRNKATKQAAEYAAALREVVSSPPSSPRCPLSASPSTSMMACV